MKRQKVEEAADGHAPHFIGAGEATMISKDCGCDAPRNYHGTEQNVFREHEKLYRAPPQPNSKASRQQIRAAQKAAAEQDFSSVIDFTKLESLKSEVRVLVEEIAPAGNPSQFFSNLTKAYTVKSVPGTNWRDFINPGRLWNSSSVKVLFSFQIHSRKLKKSTGFIDA